MALSLSNNYSFIQDERGSKYKCILLKRLYNSNSLNKVVDQWKTLKTKLYIPDCVHSLQACDLSQ